VAPPPRSGEGKENVLDAASTWGGVGQALDNPGQRIDRSGHPPKILAKASRGRPLFVFEIDRDRPTVRQGSGLLVGKRRADPLVGEGRQPRPLRHLPAGRGRGIATDVRRDPVADRPVAGAARTSMKALWGRKALTYDGERCVVMTANDRVPAPQGKANHGFSARAAVRGRTGPKRAKLPPQPRGSGECRIKW